MHGDAMTRQDLIWTQLSLLFDSELGPFQRHSETSRQAAIGNYPKSGTQRARVLLAIASGPHTDNELCDVLGLSGSSVRPRRVELLRAGLVEDSGQRRGGSVVWRTTDAGWLASFGGGEVSDAETQAMIAWLRDDRDNVRNERDAYANELALCEQDLRHALTRISELNERLAEVVRECENAKAWGGS